METLERLPLPLLEWYREHARDLPWRREPTPYHVWVSEIMLQQTRVAAVVEYYRRFLAELPDVASLAAAEEDRLLKLWQGLGYYNRARSLQRAARQIMEEHGGRFPDRYGDIRALSGVGDYTAGAIASIAFGQPVPAVDGNVLRVVSRLTGDGRDVTLPQTRRAVGEALAQVIPLRAPGDFNQALMELGAVVCLPNGAPQCARCPCAAFCAALAWGRTGELPVKPPRKPRRVEERTVFLIFYGDKVALRRRERGGLLGGLWEYPNAPAPAPCPVEAAALSPGPAGRHVFTHIEWRMTSAAVEAAGPALPAGWVWAGLEELERNYALPNAFRAFRGAVEGRLKGEEGWQSSIFDMG